MSRKHLVAHCICCTALGAERQLYSLKSKRRASRLLQEFPGHEVGDAKDGGKSLELQGGLTRVTPSIATLSCPIRIKDFFGKML